MRREGSSPADLHRRARAIFLEARERAGDARARLVRDACHGDESLRGEVESLLAFDDGGKSPVDRPALGSDFVLPDTPELVPEFHSPGTGAGEAAERPERIGLYTLLEEIGRGGMGVVYLAQQRLTRRRVALKVLRTRGHSPRRLQQFEREAQILGLLEHPGIAQIFEAGSADLGRGRQMYFAIELVEGPPITRYAAQHGLSQAERVELLARVCDAVHHAHGRAVLHRDLKPENVLVGDDGSPKVLDFGVARFDEDEHAAEQAEFERGKLVGTPAYMSPEQLVGATDELDARSDVYALGVIAHELLAGELPRAPGQVAPSLARDRDLRAILETSLAAAPDDRYSTAAELAADLRRFLAHEPLHVREATTGYVLRKFAQRKRALTFALAAIFVLLTGGVLLSTSLAIEARQQSARKEKLIEYLREVFMSPNPMHEGEDVTVLEVLAESEEMIRRRLVGEPELEAEVRLMLGQLHAARGDTRAAEPHLRIALELLRRTRGETHDTTRSAKLELARVLVQYQDKVDEPELLVRDLVGYEVEHPQSPDLITVHAMSLSASIQRKRGNRELALETYSQAETVLIGLEGEDPSELVALRSFRARILTELQRFAEADALARQTIQAAVRDLEPDHRQTLVAKLTLGYILWMELLETDDRSLLVEGESIARDTIRGRTQRLGPQHPGTLAGYRLLSNFLELSGRVEESIDAQRIVYAAYEETLGLDRADADSALERLEELLKGCGRGTEARELRVKHDLALSRKGEDL